MLIGDGHNCYMQPVTAEKPETPPGHGLHALRAGGVRAQGPFFLHQHGGIGCDKSAVRTYDAKIKRKSLLHAYIEDYQYLNVSMGFGWRMYVLSPQVAAWYPYISRSTLNTIAIISFFRRPCNRRNLPMLMTNLDNLLKTKPQLA